MSRDSRAIANYFVGKALLEDKHLSVLQLNKLVYVAHGWYMALYDGKPLIKDEIQAWKYGPVIPKVYRAFRSQGIQIKSFAEDKFGEVITEKLDPAEQNVLDQVYEIYGSMSPFMLSEKTHEAGTPWESASKRGYYARITDAEIVRHYRDLLSRAQHGQKANQSS